MRAFLFPGQGSQYVGMGRDAYINNSLVRDIFNRANEVLGFQLSGIMFEGPIEELTQTRNAQPAIFLHSYANFQILKNPRPAMTAGHSLGEYTALTVANALTFDEALRLVSIRANAMQDAGESVLGAMAAIIGLEDEAVAEVCKGFSSDGQVVQPANYNAPGQVVISGSEESVNAAMSALKTRGARLVKRLNVSGAFHSPLMASAGLQLEQALRASPISDAEFPVYSNVTASPVQDAATIRTGLLAQLTSPVQWTLSINRMVSDGATDFIEVGPGTVLQGLVKRIAEGVPVSGVDSLESATKFNQDAL